MVECRRSSSGRSSQYILTLAGTELEPVIHAIGVWGQRWVRSRMDAQDLDASFLMWGIRRNIRTEHLPSKRTVVYFEFGDAKKGMKCWWLVAENGEVDLRLEDPGHEVDLAVFSDLRCFTQNWMGDISLAAARSAGRVKL